MIIPVQKNRVYENVSAQIRSQIEQGAWKEGDRIQSEMELAKLFQVSRGSIREAIKSLQMAGIVEAHSGQGTFVAPNALQKIRDGHLADMLRTQFRSGLPHSSPSSPHKPSFLQSSAADGRYPPAC